MNKRNTGEYSLIYPFSDIYLMGTQCLEVKLVDVNSNSMRTHSIDIKCCMQWKGWTGCQQNGIECIRMKKIVPIFRLCLIAKISICLHNGLTFDETRVLVTLFIVWYLISFRLFANEYKQNKTNWKEMFSFNCKEVVSCESSQSHCIQ